MADPSEYELRAWRDIQRFKRRPLSRVMGNAGEQVAIGAAASYPFVKALNAVLRGRDDLERNKLCFLYRLNREIGDGRSKV